MNRVKENPAGAMRWLVKGAPTSSITIFSRASVRLYLGRTDSNPGANLSFSSLQRKNTPSPPLNRGWVRAYGFLTRSSRARQNHLRFWSLTTTMSDWRGVQCFPCSECDKTFLSQGGLTKHLLQKHFAWFSQPAQICANHPHLNGLELSLSRATSLYSLQMYRPAVW